ncbi:MAG: phosphocholine cytidylyltransferase family protein [Myxococcales bacterium]|nr:phosphocholine cytidylyltransferase family protein [Myxococcales bacterium]
MTAVILAAGSATRLRPLTETTPKCLLPVADEPILRRVLGQLHDLGVARAAIVVGYLEHMIRDAVAAWRLPLEVTFISNREYASTNNGYSTLLARPVVDGAEFILLDADIVCDRDVIGAVLASARADCLALRPSATLTTEEMKIVLDDAGRVRRCAKDVPPATAIGESIGVNRFSAGASRRFFAALEERVVGRGLVNEWNDSAVQQMIDEQGYELWPVDVGAHYCAEIDTAADLAEVDRYLRARAGGVIK